MDTGYKDFCEQYKKKLENDKDIEENDLEYLTDFRDRISFNVNVFISCPNTQWVGGIYNGKNLFKLDDEDLEYLYKKYSKKIVAEMEQNIVNIKKSYKDTLNDENK